MNIITKVNISEINDAERIRKTDLDYVKFLSFSLQERGLKHPITISTPDQNGLYRLLAGKHRLEAARLLGWDNIDAVVDPAQTELEQKLIEIDENLFRRELSALDKSAFLAQRQEIYELLHPETKAGSAGAFARHSQANENFSFTEDAAQKIGITQRSIQLSVRRHKLICPIVRDNISATWISEKGVILDALIKLTPDEQMSVVTTMLRAEKPQKNVASALDEIRGIEKTRLSPIEKELAAMKSSFTKASKEARFIFIDYLKEVGVVQ